MGRWSKGSRTSESQAIRYFPKVQKLLECLSAPSGLHFVFFMLSSAGYGTMDGLGNWGGGWGTGAGGGCSMTSCYLRKKKAGRFKTGGMTERSRDLVPPQQCAWVRTCFSLRRIHPNTPRAKGARWEGCLVHWPHAGIIFQSFLGGARTLEKGSYSWKSEGTSEWWSWGAVWVCLSLFPGLFKTSSKSERI